MMIRIFISVFLFFVTLPAYPNLAYVEMKTKIPANAYQYLDLIYSESTRLLDPAFEYPFYFPALIEQESCISLTHSKCFNPRSKLKTSREEGAGLPQLTRAYKTDGSLRFDTLTELRKRHMTELKELSWSNVYQRPDLQIRAMILLFRTNYQGFSSIKDSYERLAFSTAAYNGGKNGVDNERRTCGLAKDCNPQYWFFNTENYCSKSNTPLKEYGNKSICQINRTHARNVLSKRMPKYEKAYYKSHPSK